jgi:hypothetical protein
MRFDMLQGVNLQRKLVLSKVKESPQNYAQ